MNRRSSFFRCLLVLSLGFGLTVFLSAEMTKDKEIRLDESILDGVGLRCIGPANMGGRIDDVAVVESNPKVVYVGTASGGIWKTVNNGVTWRPVFDDQETSTIGDVAVAQSHPDIVWVGTGEPNNRQSSSWGNGVYKSTDGGRTWKNLGLRDSHHIGRIVIHPWNPDIVYVAALGHLWGPNKERGLFKTADGGKTWVNTKFIDENTGFVDVVMDPENPDTLYAAAYQRRRRGWGFNGGGPQSGIYKTTDGGATWERLAMGLPSGITGRIGLDVYRKDPHVVYAIVEHKEGGVFRSEDKGVTWTHMSSTNPRPMYYSQIRIDPSNDQRIWVLGAEMYYSEDGGKTFSTDIIGRERPSKVHGDHHAMWINPQDSDHMILGSDGGIYFTYDRGGTWDFVNTLPLGQFYEIGFDMRKPYYVYGGLQDNGSWGGPSATWHRHGITNSEWIKIGGGDGFYTQVDPSDHETIYVESQTGRLIRYNLKTGESRSIRPEPEDSEETYRFNWDSPILISPHNPKKIYYGGNRLFQSMDRGETWEASEDLTSQLDREKLPLMGILPDRDTLSRHDGIAYYGDITTLSESPLKEGLLYVGTDDGNLHVSRDGGNTWKNVMKKIPDVPERTYVTRIVASCHDERKAYATLDGHRNDDFTPYVFVTFDYGETWKNISKGIPEGSIVNVIREHPHNPRLLFIGTERGAYFSTDGGKMWIMLKSNFPIVPVDDIAVHPRENDLILGTHGRSIWILDDLTPLEKLSQEVLSSHFHLFDMRPATLTNVVSQKGDLGHKVFTAPNPPFGVIVDYYLKDKSSKEVRVVVSDENGKAVREIKGPQNAGINRVVWDLRHEPPKPPPDEMMRRISGSRGPLVIPGEYAVAVMIEEQELTKPVVVSGDPSLGISLEERKVQYVALMDIYRMFPVLYEVNQALESMKEQVIRVKDIIEDMPGLPEAIPAQVKTLSENIDKLKVKLLGDPKMGYRRFRSSLWGRLLMLNGAVENYTGSPTDYQKRQISKKSGELKSLVEEVNRIIDVDLPELNRVLKENGVPHLLPVKTISHDI
jgi:photosystem II stability/assembly factor-like uncharacterized protein